MFCGQVTKRICSCVQEFYIQTHISRYMKCLNDASYLKAIQMTKCQSRREMRILWDKHVKFSQYDEILDGRRKKRVVKYWSFVDDN